MRTSLLFLALLTCPSFTHCSKEGSTSAAANPVIENPGSEPQSRTAPSDGFDGEQGLSLRITLTTGYAAEGGGQAEQSVSPILGKLAYAAPSADSATYRLLDAKMSDTPMNAELKTEWTKALEALAHSDIQGSVQYDVTGRAIRNECSMPPAKSSSLGRQYVQSMKSTFDLFAVPRPVSPIGVGAVLRDSRSIEFSGLKIELDAEYTLKSVTVDSLEFATKLTMRGLPQVIDLPSSTKPGSQAQLISATATGAGTVVVSKLHVGPQRGSLDIDITMNMRMMYEGKESRMQSTTRMQYELGP